MRWMWVGIGLGACVDGGSVTETGSMPVDTGPWSTTTSGTTPQTPCAAAGFAAATEGLEGEALWDALTAATAAQTCASYSAATEHLFLVLDNVDYGVECVYTGRVVPVTDSKPDATVMNTEHTWPQSQGADRLPMRADLHHLFPSIAEANNARANLAFCDVVAAEDWEQGGSRRGEDALGTRCFEARDVHKGNVARALFYFAAAYEGRIDAAEEEVLRAWHLADRVDDAERVRNAAIEDWMGSRNPFVDFPDLVDRIADH